MDDIGVEILFYKVNQKPGKPLLLAKMGKKLIFALPGNPAASLTCYYVYVQPAILAISGRYVMQHTTSQKTLLHDLDVSNSRAQLLKAVFDENGVTILSHQESSMLRSFAIANCLVYIKEGNYIIPQGSKVETYVI